MLPFYLSGPRKVANDGMCDRSEIGVPHLDGVRVRAGGERNLIVLGKPLVHEHKLPIQRT
jgi:hypothetical protein